MTLTLTTTGGGSPTPEGVTLVTVTGTDGSITPQTTVNLVVTNGTGTAEVRFTIGDTWMNKGDTVLRGTDTSLWLYTFPINTSANAAILQFNIVGLTTLESARLYLNLLSADTDVATYDVPVHALLNYTPVVSLATANTYDGTNLWTGGTNQMAQNDLATATSTANLNQTLGWKTWDVTAILEGWIATPASNRGLLLNGDTTAAADRFREFASSDAPNTRQRPFLVIVNTGGVGDSLPPAPPSNLHVVHP